jgi:excinuclease ABC subunit C
MTFAEKVAQAPEAPGVYLLKDAKGRVLYVGKARVLRERLQAYTQPKEDPRLSSLVSKVTDLETVVTRSEVEALVLEENFIKFKKPRYNVRLRDDKKFPYLKITASELYPRIFFTRNLKEDGSVFFGPYTSAKELRKALKAVKRIFRMRTCKYRLPEDRPARPCLDFELSRCSGPCADKVTQEQYADQVKDVIRFLSGRSDELTEQVEQRMWAASQAQDFETAAVLRDQLMALREIRKNQQAVVQDKTSRDIIGLARGQKSAVAALFRVREGKIVSREEYPLTAGESAPDSELLSTVVRSVHTHTHDIPEEIILPAPIEDADALEALLNERLSNRAQDVTLMSTATKSLRAAETLRSAQGDRGGTIGRMVSHRVKIVVPERGEKVRLMELARANAEKALVELRPEERVPAGNRELAEILGLPAVPRLIEGVDISNTQGTNAVGSIVVFRDDRPTKQQYRLFKIRTVTGSNDFAMMEEVLARRVRGLLEKNRPLPDLVLVDGGKGQLSSAVKAYGQFDAEIPILGLAKRTDTLYYDDGREITIPVTSPALKLLKRIRDESHRFAITFHRKLRGKKMVESELDEIPGLGPARKKALIQHFGSLDKVRLAAVEEIAKVKGFGPALAEMVHRQLHA